MTDHLHKRLLPAITQTVGTNAYEMKTRARGLFVKFTRDTCAGNAQTVKLVIFSSSIKSKNTCVADH
ncbi:hypothetical protein CHS0354_013094 [Potamilus streckersoni]|uniref:Uncharacterized protein n=1 Tax=Potamilus streckersoni TaxID=2493646 RepID=A0AAE0VV11_9BIVA|nr:hypothetical protein CHS0354_013094 [Potamilus streckersoni]